MAVLKIYIEETMKTDVKLKIDFHDVIRLNTTIDETLLGDTYMIKSSFQLTAGVFAETRRSERIKNVVLSAPARFDRRAGRNASSLV